MTDSDSAIYGQDRPDGRDRRRRENRRHVRKIKKLLPEMFHLFTGIIAMPSGSRVLSVQSVSSVDRAKR